MDTSALPVQTPISTLQSLSKKGKVVGEIWSWSNISFAELVILRTDYVYGKTITDWLLTVWAQFTGKKCIHFGRPRMQV